jgi:predicted TPR repeat methyltransferase
MADKRSTAERCGDRANEYDQSKEAQGWRGPEVVFGLMYAFISPGESVLDIGIGTGLSSFLFHKAGLSVNGIDISPEMLDVCIKKHIAEDLKVHDLTVEPYPYATASLHHAVCIGVLNHFENLGPVFRQTSRILKDDGVFGFIVADRKPDEGPSFEVEHADSRITMFRHSKDQVGSMLDKTGFEFLRELEFSVAGHRDRNQCMRLKAYAARRKKRIEQPDRKQLR